MQNITVPDSIPTSEIPVNNLKITVNFETTSNQSSPNESYISHRS